MVDWRGLSVLQSLIFASPSPSRASLHFTDIHSNITATDIPMPPKKKTKVPSRAAPTDADSPLPEPVIFDGWTDEQETTLFKAISVYRLKPAGEPPPPQFYLKSLTPSGMHKHFRIIGISELMKNHGVSDTHTNIEGIWRKLQSLYNLEGLDERVLPHPSPPSPKTHTKTGRPRR